MLDSFQKYIETRKLEDMYDEINRRKKKKTLGMYGYSSGQGMEM